MYDRIVSDFKLRHPGFPAHAAPEMGIAIKQIRLRMGFTQGELAQNARIKLSALKTLENGYAKFTKASNLEAMAHVLRIEPRDIILEAREWYPGNFFVSKSARTEDSGQERTRKMREETLFEKKTLNYETFRADLLSPPLNAPSYFCFGILEVAPGKMAKGFKLSRPEQITGFVQRGTLKVTYDSGKDFHIFGNQAFCLRGDKPHDFTNMDKENPLRMCLAFSPAATGGKTQAPKAKIKNGTMSVGRAIRFIRDLRSGSHSRALSFSDLSKLTGVDAKALKYLEDTTKPDQVIYWDKIEKIASALRISFAEMLDFMEGKDEGYFRIATAHDRALIDYRHYLGVRIKSAVFPDTDNRFHLSETYIEPKSGIRRVSWKRVDNAKIAIYVEDGELLVEVGKNRKVGLKQNDSVYFDGSLGYMFTNPGVKPAKLLMAAHPPIIF